MTDSMIRAEEDQSSPIAPTPDPQGAMGKKVGRGMIVMVASAFAHRGLSLVVQMALGILLTKADFGVFAIATASAAIAQVFRDGGLRFILLQRGVRDFDAIAGPVFWMSMAFNLATAAAIAAAAPVLAYIYQAPQLTIMLLLVAVTVPAGTVQMMCETRLRIDLRFGMLAKIGLVSAMLRYGVTVAAAWAGAGPLSMIYGLLSATLFELLATYVAAPCRPWQLPPRIEMWRELFAQGKWTIVQMLAISTMYYGMYASIGLFVDKDTVGIFSFAFSIVSVSGHLLATQFDSVLVPSLARLQNDAVRRHAALVRSLHAMIATCVPVSLLVGIVYAPVEQLVWRGVWTISTPCVWVLAITYPFFILHVLPRAALTASGHFRRSACLMLVIGVGVMLSAGLAAWVGHSATWIAVGAGVYSAAAGLWMLERGLRPMGVRLSEILEAVVPISIVLTLAAAGVTWADRSFFSGLHPLIRLPIVAAAGTIVLGLPLRVMFAPFLHDVLAITPARLAGPVRFFLLMPHSPAAVPA